jgi:hypothetical protein
MEIRPTAAGGVSDCRNYLPNVRESVNRTSATVSFGEKARAILTDSHFLLPVAVFLAGIALLVMLH